MLEQVLLFTVEEGKQLKNRDIFSNVCILRSVHRLVDKGGHGESLTDLESLTCWLSILITPVSFATAAANGALAAGARNSGRIFSSTVRTAATILNFTNFGLSSVMFVCGLANLIEKAQNDQLTALDIL